MYRQRWRVLFNALFILVVLALAGLCSGILVPYLGALLVLLALPAAVAYYLGAPRLIEHMARSRIYARAPLTDEQFFDQFYAHRGVERGVVIAVRGLLARQFRDVGGDRLRPTDRLANVLCLVQFPQVRLEDLLTDIAEQFEVRRSDLAGVRWDTLDDVIWTVRGLTYPPRLR